MTLAQSGFVQDPFADFLRKGEYFARQLGHV